MPLPRWVHKPAGQLICPPWQIKSGRLGAANQPDGQITSDFQKSCQAPKSKIFCFAADPNQMHIQNRPGPIEGRFAIVTDVGQGMRWTRQRQASNSEPDE
jgi:hypothetical protein